MVMKPFTNMKSAQTGRSGKRPSRCERRRRTWSARTTSGSSSSRGFFSLTRGSAIEPPIQPKHEQEQRGVDREENERRDGRRNQHLRLTREERVDRRRHQPELYHHQR